MILPALGLAAFWWPQFQLPDRPPSASSVFMLAGLLSMALWAGTYGLMLDYPLTRDEQLVGFDAQIFASGQLAQPLPPEWQGYAKAFIPDYLLGSVPNDSLLVSTYLPGNAMLRAAFGAVADPALMNPLLWAVGFIALYDIARRLFADQPSAIWIVLAIYLLSAQVLVNAMTSYAMTGHLTLNLVWLALFLRGKWWQHLLAIAIGAWALGLHQVSYHPLFVGPFLFVLLIKRSWTLLALYTLGYTAAVMFWFSYPSLVLSSFGIEASSGATAGMVGYFERIWGGLGGRIDLVQSALMEFNILRFMVWTPIFLLPLVILAWPDIKRLDGLAFALFLGIIAMLLMRTILLPYQGHGWGYRSLHGFIGSFALLAGYGYVHWAKHNRERADGTLMVLGGATAFVILPFLLWSAHQFTAPYARLSAAIERQPTDFVVVDTDTSRDARDQVRNRADLSNRPLVFASSNLGDAQLEELCERGSVTWVGAEDIAAAQLPMRAGLSPETKNLDPAQFTDCLQPFDRSEL